MEVGDTKNKKAGNNNYRNENQDDGSEGAQVGRLGIGNMISRSSKHLSFRDDSTTITLQRTLDPVVLLFEHLDADDIVVVTEITSSGSKSQVITCGQSNPTNAHTSLPFPLVVNIFVDLENEINTRHRNRTNRESVSDESNQNLGVVVSVAELGFTSCMFPTELSVSSISIMVVVKSSVRNHSGDVRMSMFVGTVVVTVSIEEDTESAEEVLRPEDVSENLRLLDVPDG